VGPRAGLDAGARKKSAPVGDRTIKKHNYKQKLDAHENNFISSELS
jgi:hypothetical protein